MASRRNFTLYEQEPVWFWAGWHSCTLLETASILLYFREFPLRSYRQGGADESLGQAPSTGRQAHCERNPHLVVRSELVEGDSIKALSDKKEWLLTWQQRPKFAYKTLLGREIHCQQPSGRLADGTTIFKY